MVRTLLIVTLCSAALLAGDDDEGIGPAQKSPRAKRIRADAMELWTPHKALYELVRKDKPVEPDVAAKAVEDLEKAVALFEKALQMEWNAEANAEQANAARAWFKLQAALPQPQPPEDPEARKRFDKEQKAERMKRLRDARKFLMDYSRARRYAKLFSRCGRCEGRKDLRSPFGDKRACPTCARRGIMPNKKEIVRAHWWVYSPLHRADARNERTVTRMLHTGHTRPESLGPFTRSLSIDEIEDHGTWMRVRTREKTHVEPTAKRFEKEKKSYVLIRVGKLWFLYSPRHDRDLIEVPREEEPAPEK